MAAPSMPRRAAVPGRKFSITTSAPTQRSSTRASPSGCLRSIATLRLLRLTARKYAASPPAYGGPQVRVSSPSPGRSTLTTSAPRSASTIVAYGPARTRERSTTRTPSRSASPALADDGNGLDLEPGTGDGEGGDLHQRAGRPRRAESLLSHHVDAGAVADIGQEERHLDHVRERHACGLQNGAHVREHLARLCDDVVASDQPPVRVDGHDAGYEQQRSLHADGVGVVAERLGLPRSPDLPAARHGSTRTRPGEPARLASTASLTSSSGNLGPTSGSSWSAPLRTCSSSTGSARRGSSEPYMDPVSSFSRRTNSAGSRSSRSPAAGRPTRTVRPPFRVQRSANAVVSGAPTASSATSAPSGATSRSVSRSPSGVAVRVAPSRAACPSRASSGSMQTISAAPAMRAPWTQNWPTPPAPTTSTTEPGSGRAWESTAPTPVSAAQPRSAACSSGTSPPSGSATSTSTVSSSDSAPVAVPR